MLINEILKETRKKAGLTQEYVSKKMFISRSTYAQYESGKRTISAEMFFNVMKVFEEKFSFISQTENLFDWIYEGNLKEVKQYFENGMDIEILNKDGYRPFLYACICNQPYILEYLIEIGSPYNSISDINWIEYHGHNKLIDALQKSNLHIAKSLMNANLNIEREIELAKVLGQGFSPLRSMLFFNFEINGNPIPIDLIEKLANNLLKIDESKLIEEHIYLAEYWTSKFQRECDLLFLSEDELMSSAMKGIQTASKKYNFEKGYTFKTYCQWFIRQHICRTNVEKTGLPIHLFDYYTKFKKTYEQELQSTGKRLSKEDICTVFSVDISLLNKIENKFRGIVFWNDYQ